MTIYPQFCISYVTNRQVTTMLVGQMGYFKQCSRTLWNTVRCFILIPLILLMHNGMSSFELIRDFRSRHTLCPQFICTVNNYYGCILRRYRLD